MQLINHSFVLSHFVVFVVGLVAELVLVSVVVALVLVAVVGLLAATAAAAVAETLDNADDRDAQQEGHQAANLGNKLDGEKMCFKHSTIETELHLLFFKPVVFKS